MPRSPSECMSSEQTIVLLEFHPVTMLMVFRGEQKLRGKIMHGRHASLMDSLTTRRCMLW